MIRVRVPSEAAGERLDRFLAALPELGSRSSAERLFTGGTVLVNGAARTKSHRLEGGEEVEFAPPPAGAQLEPEPIELRIAYEDPHLLVIDKPAGLVIHPGAGRQKGTLVHGLLGRVAGGPAERPGIVHRLDRDTSGLLVVARTEESYRRLSSLVSRRKVEREYLALVRGRPRSRRGRIEGPIGRDRNDRTRRSLDTDSPRDAVTHFELAEPLPAHSLLRITLVTGRTHQIRVHLSAIDLPVVGDPVYGVSGLDLERQFLHATRLAFDHPATGERLEVVSPLPQDLQQALERARG
ncbi:MAG: RluA family pseudouridine synthase [Candidatus Rokuibacteriota bacterium]|nr:MAG: RluA family pseudouridine synthase [Candidatus Rokubacteria bacterium]